MNTAPMLEVRTNHSRRPQPLTLRTEPVRPTWPRSAANTPSWQVSEESTRIVVLTAAKGTFSFSVFWAHRSGLTARIVKYDANRAAKNISSLESQMIVPTETMLGRSWCPCRREAGIAVAVATAPLCRDPDPRAPRPPGFPRHKVHSVLPASVGVLLDAGSDLPRFTLGTVLPGWARAPGAFVLAVWVAGLYVWGVVTLHRRGDRWPVGRTIAFVPVGMGLFYFATASGLGTYDDTLISVHMVQHMILSMLVPMALALGAPVTLALRTLPSGPRRWLLVVLHSRVARVLSFPPLTFALYVISPWALYFTGWYPATLESTYLHEMMHIHLVLVGCLFFWPIVGVDPVPGKVAHPFRILLLFATMPFHAFLGVAIMTVDDSGKGLIAPEHYLPLLGRADAVFQQ